MTFLSTICQALAARGVRYAIVGGHAVALHGALRGTVDIDIAVNWNARSVRAVEATLNELGLVSRLPLTAEDVFQYRDEYVRNRNLAGWNFYNPQDPTQQVDVIVVYDLKGKRRQRVQTADGPIYVLARDELVAMKQASGRAQDLEDADALERLP